MVNEERLLKIFLKLARIDSPSRGERKFADEIMQMLTERGIEVFEDDSAESFGGSCGNIICYLPSNIDESNMPGIMFSAHMDTVGPCEGKNIIVDEENEIIHTDGRTILGSDDVAGVAAIIEAFFEIKEMGTPHGDIWGVFTPAEEVGLCGSKTIDLKKNNITAKHGYVLDAGGPIGTCYNQGPTQNTIKLRFRGKAAHAGIEPEKGINAIVMAAEAITQFPQGRIDEETTCNVGVVSGGIATNIVCDFATVELEVRGLSRKRADGVTADILSKCNGDVSMEINNAYPEYCISEEAPVVREFSKACMQIGVKPILAKTGGGSDTNFYNKKGITTVNISVGMDKVHTTSECIKISDLSKACALVYELCWK